MSVCVSDLQVLWMHGEKGQGLAQFYIPHSVTVDSYQRVCVHPHFCFWITSTQKHALPQIIPDQMSLILHQVGEMCLSNGCSAVNGCRQTESQWMFCSEWVPSDWESMDALQWMGAVRLRVNGCSAVNGCRQTESQWMLCSEWVPSEWESMDALQWMGAVRMRVNGCSAVNGCRQNESQWMLCSEWVPSDWESMDALQWMGAVRLRVNGCSAVNGCRQNESLIITLPPVIKCICCRLSLIKIQPHIWFELFCLVNAADFSPDSDQNTVSLEEELWFIWVKNVLMLGLFQFLSSPDVNWWTGVLWCFYQTLILTAPIHCRASIAETHFSKPDEETNSSTSQMICMFSSDLVCGWTSALRSRLTALQQSGGLWM